MTMPMNDFDSTDLGAKLPEGNQPEPDIVKLTDLDIGEMEIEDMQALWNSQSHEKLFAIDEATLHDYIRGKGQKVDLLLQIVEWLMIVVNLGVGVFLLYDSLRDKDPMLDYLLPIMYLGYFAFILYRRIARRQDEVQFAPTILGDLDKAIWRVDYLIRQGTSIILWYLVPLVLTLMVVTYLNSRLTWAIGLIVLTIPAAYFGSMWEARKFYMPKKRELEALREKLTASPQ